MHILLLIITYVLKISETWHLTYKENKIIFKKTDKLASWPQRGAVISLKKKKKRELSTCTSPPFIITLKVL